MKKFCKFTNDGLRIVTTQITKNIQSSFLLKDKTNYKLCVNYKGDCPCGSSYIAETKSYAEVRWNKHNRPTKSLEPSKHLQNAIEHCFTWNITSKTPQNAMTRKNLEASSNALWKPGLN